MTTENPDAKRYTGRRRKRAFAGATWTPDSVSAIAGEGIWCRFHKMRHGYKSAQLGITYDKASDGKWMILWYCRESKNVLMETKLGENHVPEV